MRPIRSLHVSDLTDSGGAEAVFTDTVRAARALGHDVTTLVSDGRRSATSYLFSLRWYRRMRTALRDTSPDVVHLQNYYRFLSPSVLLAIRHHRRTQPDLKVVYTAHDYHLACPNSGFQHFPGGRRTTFDRAHPRIPALARFDDRTAAHSLLKALEHLLAYRVIRLQSEIDLLVSPSEQLRGVLARAGVAVESVLVRNPVHNLPVAQPAGGALDVNRPDTAVSLVYLGRVAPEKGLTELIGALERVAAEPGAKPVQLDIYGSGAAIPALTRQVRTLHHLEVRLRPRVPRRRVGEVLSRHDAFVYPSIWPENAPISVVEAAVAGLPVLVSRDTGAAEVAQRSQQWVEFDPHDAESVRTALTTLQRFRGRNRILRPEEFSATEFQTRLGDIYDRLVGTDAPAEPGRRSAR